MAVAVDFRQYTPVDSRDDLIRKIQEAPAEHAEALLSTYELLGRLHERGVLDLLNGALSAGNSIVNQAAGLISSKEMVTALRIGLIFSNLLSSIDADALQEAVAGEEELPSFLSIGRKATSKEARRGMATGVALLNVFGAALLKQQTGKNK